MAPTFREDSITGIPIAETFCWNPERYDEHQSKEMERLIGPGKTEPGLYS